MLPVLGRVIEVGQQSVLVEGQRRDGLRILGAVRGAEAGDLALSGRAGLGVHDLVQRLLGPRLEALGELVQDVGDPVDPTALLCRLWPHVADGGPESQRAIPNGQYRRAQPAPLEIPQQRAPALRALPIAVLEGDHFLGAVRAHTDQDERAQAVLFQPDAEVHAVRPEIDVVAVRQVPAAEGFVLRGPRLRQPEDRARRQAGRVRPEQGRQRLAEVTRRQAVQIEQRQDTLHPRRPPDVRRQDRARELLAPAVDHAPIVHAGRGYGQRAHSRRHRARARRPVAYNECVPHGVSLVPKARHIVLDFDLQRGGDHALRPGARQVIERRPDQGLLRYFRLRSDKLQHRWRTFPPGWHRGVGVWCSTSPEGYVAFLSHPQLSTIAPFDVAAGAARLGDQVRRTLLLRPHGGK